jgi:hypothetical protein
MLLVPPARTVRGLANARASENIVASPLVFPGARNKTRTHVTRHLSRRNETREMERHLGQDAFFGIIYFDRAVPYGRNLRKYVFGQTTGTLPPVPTDASCFVFRGEQVKYIVLKRTRYPTRYGAHRTERGDRDTVDAALRRRFRSFFGIKSIQSSSGRRDPSRAWSDHPWNP